MTWLYEDPLPILFTGLAVTAIVSIILAQVSRRVGWLALLGCAAVTGGLLLIERWMVTDEERIEAVIYDTADRVVAGDIDGVLANMSPDATEMRAYVLHHLPLVVVSKIKLMDHPKIQINRLTSPPSAVATFRARIEGGRQKSSYHGNIFPNFTVHFILRSDRWYISDYEDSGQGDSYRIPRVALPR